MSVLQDMVGILLLLVWVVPIVELPPSRAMWEIPSVLHALLELKLETQSQLPRAQTLVFVEEMLS